MSGRQRQEREKSCFGGGVAHSIVGGKGSAGTGEGKYRVKRERPTRLEATDPSTYISSGILIRTHLQTAKREAPRSSEREGPRRYADCVDWSGALLAIKVERKRYQCCSASIVSENTCSTTSTQNHAAGAGLEQCSVKSTHGLLSVALEDVDEDAEDADATTRDELMISSCWCVTIQDGWKSLKNACKKRRRKNRCNMNVWRDWPAGGRT